MMPRVLMESPREPVFYSFHFANDVMRVQQIRQMGMIEGNTPVSPNDWEEIKQKGDAAVEKWIDDNMKRKRCVVVLVGSETANRPWVQHEIRKAWNDHRGLFGIYIHDLNCPRTGTCYQGANPFSAIEMDNGRPMSDYVSCHEPTSWDAYREISENLQGWVAAPSPKPKHGGREAAPATHNPRPPSPGHQAW